MSYGKNQFKENGVQRFKQDKWVLSEKPIEDLIIIPEEQWKEVQDIRAKRDPNKGNNPIPNTKSPLLLIGYIYCRHCGNPLTTTYNYKKWINKDGTEHRKTIAKYRCTGKALAKTDCDGQTIYAQKKVEERFVEMLKVFINKLQLIDFEKEINKRTLELEKGNIRVLRELQKKNEENYSELAALNSEVARSIVGKSSFKPELLSYLIEQKEREIQDTNKHIEKLEKAICSDKQQIDNLKKLQKLIPVWWENYETATIEEKKIILSYILGKVYISRDGIEIKFNDWIEQLLSKTKEYQ